MAPDRGLGGLLKSLSPEAKQLVTRVIEIEREYIHMGNPRGIHDELMSAVEETVR